MPEGNPTQTSTRQAKPKWLKVKLPVGRSYRSLKEIVNQHQLHTICQSGNCPNMGECWTAGTATFMILGNICTRSCGFCAVATGRPLPADNKEPQRVAEAIHLMKVKHAVITSVDRDDLPDGGSAIWASTVRAIREMNPKTSLETLIPDFKGRQEDLNRVIEVHPEVISHNLETVKRLSRLIRPQAKYERSLLVLSRIKAAGITTKSGIMLGLGEERDEIIQTMSDLCKAGVDVLTIGQYLQPSKMHAELIRYVSPEEFENYRVIGLEMGFRIVESSPLVRSSYHAERHVL